MEMRRKLFSPLASMCTALWITMTHAAWVAADSTLTTTTRTTSTVWYGQWWMWAAGVGVFLIIVIALTNRGGRSA